MSKSDGRQRESFRAGKLIVHRGEQALYSDRFERSDRRCRGRERDVMLTLVAAALLLGLLFARRAYWSWVASGGLLLLAAHASAAPESPPDGLRPGERASLKAQIRHYGVGA